MGEFLGPVVLWVSSFEINLSQNFQWVGLFRLVVNKISKREFERKHICSFDNIFENKSSCKLFLAHLF